MQDTLDQGCAQHALNLTISRSEVFWIEKCYFRETRISLPNLWKTAKIYGVLKIINTQGNSDKFKQAVCTKVISLRLNFHTSYERTFKNQKFDYSLSNLRENVWGLICSIRLNNFIEN